MELVGLDSLEMSLGIELSTLAYVLMCVVLEPSTI
jgi:hypothetical protein